MVHMGGGGALTYTVPKETSAYLLFVMLFVFFSFLSFSYFQWVSKQVRLHSTSSLCGTLLCQSLGQNA